jgi:hypothetical protein
MNVYYFCITIDIYSIRIVNFLHMYTVFMFIYLQLSNIHVVYVFMFIYLQLSTIIRTYMYLCMFIYLQYLVQFGELP